MMINSSFTSILCNLIVSKVLKFSLADLKPFLIFNLIHIYAFSYLSSMIGRAKAGCRLDKHLKVVDLERSGERKTREVHVCCYTREN